MENQSSPNERKTRVSVQGLPEKRPRQSAPKLIKLRRRRFKIEPYSEPLPANTYHVGIGGLIIEGELLVNSIANVRKQIEKLTAGAHIWDDQVFQKVVRLMQIQVGLNRQLLENAKVLLGGCK